MTEALNAAAAMYGSVERNGPLPMTLETSEVLDRSAIDLERLTPASKCRA
jgi:hypothetical protein